MFGFGVVLLQLLTRVPAREGLVRWARPYLENKRSIASVMDERLDGHYPLDAARKAARLASQCLSTDPNRRPTMDQVVKALEQLQDAKEKKDRKLTLIPGSTEREPARTSKNKGISQWLKGSRLKPAGMDSNPAATTSQESTG